MIYATEIFMERATRQWWLRAFDEGETIPPIACRNAVEAADTAILIMRLHRGDDYASMADHDRRTQADDKIAPWE